MRAFLLVALLSTITLVNFLSALHGYRASMEEAQQLFDEQIAATARLLGAMPESSRAPLVVPRAQRQLFQVWSASGNLLMRSENAPAKPIAEFEEGYRDVNLAGYRWHVYAHRFLPNGRWVLVGERTDLRYQLAEEVVLESVLPILLGLPVAGLLIWLVIGHGLSSLRRLAQMLRLKRAEDLEPLPLDDPPKELLPVVESTNELLARLQASFERERRFSADAAHELRTPIAAIQVHTHNLESELREQGLKEAPASLDQVKSSTGRMARLVEQMLDLFRTTPEHYPARFEELDLHQLTREVLVEHYGEFAGKSQSIELSGSWAPLLGDRFALTILLKNLLKNAHKYTPAGGNIEVNTERVADLVTLRVDDSGPGIPASEYERIFDRFYRAGGEDGRSADGCGLGLSIVQHIAWLHRASIRLGRSKFGRGLAIHVDFPADKGPGAAQGDPDE